MNNVGNPFAVGKKEHPLLLGSSFDSEPDCAFHTIRYDFKPASVDTSQMATVEIGEKNQVQITVPNIESSGTSHTCYKGNKRACAKECLLVFDQETGTFTLERLSYNIQVKKTRIEGSSKAQLQMTRPATPVETMKIKEIKNSPSKPKITKKNRQPKTPAIIAPEIDPIVSSTSSDSEPEFVAVSSNQSASIASTPQEDNTDYMAMLSKDLQLSESGSDDDSD